MKRAILALADGTVFEGRALGFEGESVGEVVFHTAMTGYQEILTDPSYKGQIITMTCPHIGNYGVTREDTESRRIWAEGFVVRESSRRPSNWRGEQSLHDYLRQSRVVGIEGLDTRALTRHLRDAGSQQGMISQVDLDPRRGVEKARAAPGIVGRDLVSEVTCSRSYQWEDGSGVWAPDPFGEPSRTSSLERKFRVVAYDFGIKQNILRRLVDVGCAVTVVPAATPAESVKAMQPDGVVLSNGPGDPEGVPYAVEAARNLIGWRPVFGICLGHQILGLAMGLKTYKLKFGHHAANHPVMDLRTRKVGITSQNHNFAVRTPGPIDPRSSHQTVVETRFGRVEISHLSLNDDSIEGMVCLDHPVLSVQYHPEASPGPHDSAYLFRQFAQMMEKQDSGHG
ncbi:MAG: glutamine-hydrolyzing carbamoyl-phosphate synthase small subunit [Nitrospirota bacterium]|mgnify:CR=1 FL=1